ncbi:hypothetical protein RSM1_03905 [Methylobacterium radiotolerans]|nr:hypothetical protein RSM1_03905 [Methylobacterium radiotolerans]
MVLDRQRAAASPPFSACLQIRSARAAARRQDGARVPSPVRERDRVQPIYFTNGFVFDSTEQAADIFAGRRTAR